MLWERELTSAVFRIQRWQARLPWQIRGDPSTGFKIQQRVETEEGQGDQDGDKQSGDTSRETCVA